MLPSVAIVAVVAIDHYLASNYPNGGQLIQDNNSDAMTDKFLYGEGAGISYEDGSLTVCDTKVGAYSGVAEYENGEMSLATFLTAEASLEMGPTETNISAMASIYTMYGSYSFDLWGRNITLSAELNVGAVGGEIKFDPKCGEFAFAPPSVGIIPKFGLDID